MCCVLRPDPLLVQQIRDQNDICSIPNRKENFAKGHGYGCMANFSGNAPGYKLSQQCEKLFDQSHCHESAYREILGRHMTCVICDIAIKGVEDGSQLMEGSGRVTG